MANLPRSVRALGVLGALAALAACTSTSSSSPIGSTSATASAAPSQDACATQNLTTKVPGTLTVGTDNPAFPPYFDPPNASAGETATTPWELGDPTNSRGFESAVAYAIADQLGFASTKVAWTVVPFDSSFAPGDKTFDVYLAQVSYSAERAAAVDLSDGYYSLNQALVARANTPIAGATTISQVATYKLGVALGTTSLTYIGERIHPTTEASVYNDNDGAIAALKAGQVAGIVVDLPTAFYITAAQMDDGVIVGQFPAAAGDQEHFSVVLQLHSPLTNCVNAAIAALKQGGKLATITQEWLSDKANAPRITE